MKRTEFQNCYKKAYKQPVVVKFRTLRCIHYATNDEFLQIAIFQRFILFLTERCFATCRLRQAPAELLPLKSSSLYTSFRRKGFFDINTKNRRRQCWFFFYVLLP